MGDPRALRQEVHGRAIVVSTPAFVPILPGTNVVPPVRTLGHYRHYKGNEYTVVGNARHSETLAELVVYRQEYCECFGGGESGGLLNILAGELVFQAIGLYGNRSHIALKFLGSEPPLWDPSLAHQPVTLVDSEADKGSRSVPLPNQGGKVGLERSDSGRPHNDCFKVELVWLFGHGYSMAAFVRKAHRDLITIDG
jgi:hypothetical protein